MTENDVGGLSPPFARITDAVDAYVDFFERLTVERLDALDALAAPEMRFVDPFNDVRGVERVKAVFRKMFEDVEAPRFSVSDRAIGDRAAYLRWTFTFRPPRTIKTWTIEGMSELRFDPHLRITEHIDHWDAAGQLYEKFPVLGRVLGLIRRRLAV